MHFERNELLAFDPDTFETENKLAYYHDKHYWVSNRLIDWVDTGYPWIAVEHDVTSIILSLIWIAIWQSRLYPTPVIDPYARNLVDWSKKPIFSRGWHWTGM